MKSETIKTTIHQVKLLLIFLSLLFFSNCTLPTEQETREKPEKKEIPCGMYKDKQLFKGINGGCFYYNKKGNRTYINRLDCKC